jgi:hypothetical protein
LARTLYQERGGDFRKRLLLGVESRRGKARILVTGQIGVGKSSELWDFREDSARDGNRGFPIFCDLEKEESPDRCGSTGLFLTILRDCWASTQSFQRRGAGDRAALDRIRDEILSRLVDWFHASFSEDHAWVIFKFSGVDYPISLADRSRALAIALGKVAFHESVANPAQRYALPPDTLVILLNKLLSWFARGDRSRRPLLIVDHVDKIRDPNAAEDVLVRVAPHWNKVEASLIMTAPFEYTLGSQREPVRQRWDRVEMLYPLDIPSDNPEPIPKIYWAIARSAGLGTLISEEALRLLARNSGGILRDYVQFLADAAEEAHLADSDRIEFGEAAAVVFKTEQKYLDYGAKELELIDQIERTGGGLAEAASLLRSPIGLLVTEPREGKDGIRVHPLAQTRLEQYRTRKLGARA